VRWPRTTTPSAGSGCREPARDVTLRAELSRLLSVHPVAAPREGAPALAAGHRCRLHEPRDRHRVAAYLLTPRPELLPHVVAGRQGGFAYPGRPARTRTERSTWPSPAATEAATVVRLAPPLEAALEAEGSRLHRRSSYPSCASSPAWRTSGSPSTRWSCARIADELIGDTKALEEEIQRQAGHAFNVNSTPQLRTVLYDELGSPTRKTKTGYSTDAQTLETLRDEHPIVEALLRYREVEKLRSTYARRCSPRWRSTAGSSVVPPTGGSDRAALLRAAHTCTHPGAHRRRSPVPPGVRALCGRVLPRGGLRPGGTAGPRHLSGDPGCSRPSPPGRHPRAVASGIYGVEPAEVTREQRERAKMSPTASPMAWRLRPLAAAERSRRRSPRDHGPLLPRVPRGARLHGGTVAEARSRGYTARCSAGSARCPS